MVIGRAYKRRESLKKEAVFVFTALFWVLCLFMTYVSEAKAEGSWAVNAEGVNEGTGYHLILEDDAGLLTNEERMTLQWKMEPITQYGNVAFKTIRENASSAADFAESYYHAKFGRESGTLFLIDMDNRKIWIFSDGAIYKVINENYAETVTDNVYRYATNGEYYRCSAQAYDEIYTLLQGGRISQPMKYISNLLLALILALFVNFLLAGYMSKLRAPSDNEILDNAVADFSHTPPEAVYKYQTRRHAPRSGGGGSSGGGGGRSGGGGGHSF
ncbi:MAG: TPM domain-containing protein [Lachnoclostridium sp.]|nr:TPM domain-containing protein [Lachnospira sp.]MCM1248206.1 TPM domain-containing protein [Lachnoclostridium sp.]